jgi:hypothetical protein
MPLVYPGQPHRSLNDMTQTTAPANAPLHIYTSAACNYIPKVRMLFNSLRVHHPEARLHLLLADKKTDLIDLSQEPFDEVTAIEDLPIPKVTGWSYCHTIVELATAIKPFFLAEILKRPGVEKVLYLDPDMVVFSRLDDIIEALDHSNLVLTPHQVDPDETIQAIIDNEISSLKHGIYNLGFIGVRNTAESQRFAAWWSHRVYHFCRAEIPNGLFTDQRWIDLVPAFFEGVAIARSPRHNVAPWNVTTRELSKDKEGKYWVNSEALGFYHFTGFDSGAHKIMSRKNGGNNDSLHELVQWYEDSTRDLSKDPLSQVPWAFGTYADGASIRKEERFLYRQRPDLQRAFEDPFATDGSTGLKAWMQHQGPAEYAALFNPATSQATQAEMARTVGLVFHADAAPTMASQAVRKLSATISDPSEAVRLMKRSIEVLRTEGLSGIKRRLS